MAKPLFTPGQTPQAHDLCVRHPHLRTVGKVDCSHILLPAFGLICGVGFVGELHHRLHVHGHLAPAVHQRLKPLNAGSAKPLERIVWQSVTP